MFWAQVPVITSIGIKAWSLYKTDETLQTYMIMVGSRSTISILTLQAMSGLAGLAGLAGELYFSKPNRTEKTPKRSYHACHQFLQYYILNQLLISNMFRMITSILYPRYPCSLPHLRTIFTY